MVRKHLVVASALVLLMAVTAQAALHVRIDNSTAYQQLRSMGNLLKGATFTDNLTLTTTGGTGSVSVSAATSTSGGTSTGYNGVVITGYNTVSSGTASVSGTGTLPVTVSLDNYAQRLRGTLTVPTSAGTLSISYRGDVGVAPRINRRPVSVTDFIGTKAQLSAKVSAPVGGAPVSATELAATSLSSEVAPRGTLAADTHLETAVSKVTYTTRGTRTTASRSPLRQLYGVVGSEATIADSTVAPAAGSVTMEWRARTPGEAHAVVRGVGPQKDSTLVGSGGAWLSSDVVKVGGINAGVYAMQMSFDDRINLSFDGPVNGTVANEVTSGSLEIGQYNATTKHWEKTTPTAYAADPANHCQGVNESLAQFLTEKLTGGVTLDQLLGSWGVDQSDASTTHPFGVSTQGKGYSWAIVAGGGSGIFAVVPEPSSLALLVAAGLGLGIFGARRRSRKTVA